MVVFVPCICPFLKHWGAVEEPRAPDGYFAGCAAGAAGQPLSPFTATGLSSAQMPNVLQAQADAFLGAWMFTFGPCWGVQGLRQARARSAAERPGRCSEGAREPERSRLQRQLSCSWFQRKSGSALLMLPGPRSLTRIEFRHEAVLAECAPVRLALLAREIPILGFPCGERVAFAYREGIEAAPGNHLAVMVSPSLPRHRPMKRALCTAAPLASSHRITSASSREPLLRAHR